jgi:CRISPR-associated protein (TIGR02584 family)
MKQQKPRNVLLCVAGLTPQIITETLYALTQERKERVHEIRVITTIIGRNKVQQLLLDPQTGKFFEFCRDYDINPASIKFDETTITLLQSPDGRTLADIRTPEDNVYAGNHICEIVRELAKDSNIRLHASAAGGRKTMSIYLTAAMQLFGRTQDALSHVLVSEEFEQHPDFFYIPPTPRMLKKRDGKKISTKQGQIFLADIPFIRLQGVMWDKLHKGDGGYDQIVRQTQDDLNLLESTHDLFLDLARQKITVANQSIKLPEREFFIYALFGYLRKKDVGEEGFVGFKEISKRHLDLLFRMITKARGLERSLEDHELLPKFNFIGKLSDYIKNDDSKSLSETFLQVISKIKGKFEKAGRLDRYLIVNRGDRGSSRYGLEVAPDRIIFRK